MMLTLKNARTIYQPSESLREQLEKVRQAYFGSALISKCGEMVLYAGPLDGQAWELVRPHYPKECLLLQYVGEGIWEIVP